MNYLLNGVAFALAGRQQEINKCQWHTDRSRTYRGRLEGLHLNEQGFHFPRRRQNPAKLIVVLSQSEGTKVPFSGLSEKKQNKTFVLHFFNGRLTFPLTQSLIMSRNLD